MITLYTMFAGVFSVFLPLNSIFESTVLYPVTVEQSKIFTGIFTGVLTCIVYYGLWSMSPWGLWLGRLYFVISISLSIICVLFIKPQTSLVNMNVFFMLIETWILSYLFQIDCSMSVQCWKLSEWRFKWNYSGWFIILVPIIMLLSNLFVVIYIWLFLQIPTIYPQ